MTRPVVALALVAVVALAGCSGGPSRVVAAGSPAAVDTAALDGTGYEYVGTTNRTLNTTVQSAISGDVQLDAERPVTATTPIATYRRGTDSGPALLLVATAPAVRPVENQPTVRNPLGTLSTADLVGYLQSTYAVESLTRGENATVRLLGNETVARTDTGVATYDGKSTRVVVTVASVRDGDEFVTVVAVAPRSVADHERVKRVVAGVTH
ncbi:DUF6517 family protein [Haloarcula sp. JP-L23]|uniref:DUF6517 family protein n=1 Tax=Haloarcula sp. JP-L23 TaxID=2716717 RepID=UPI00140EE17B|nr:hypothetical protein G9465_07535 [Haloarcula sp. JP-L23]